MSHLQETWNRIQTAWDRVDDLDNLNSQLVDVSELPGIGVEDGDQEESPEDEDEYSDDEDEDDDEEDEEED